MTGLGPKSEGLFDTKRYLFHKVIYVHGRVKKKGISFV